VSTRLSIQATTHTFLSIAECNNALIYPGLGLGAIVSKSRSMSDTMLLAGTQALASLAPALKDPDQALLPDFQGKFE
jgi:malate dehydrogenase (oxaloacetate-decarboxylating)